MVDLIIKNYRCFPDSHPARISIRKGFTAFVGVNNSGKSSLLKFFYEFRGLFMTLQQSPGQFVSALTGSRPGFSPAPSIYDPNEIFSNANDRDLEAELRFFDDRDPHGSLPKPTALLIRIPRNTNVWIVNLLLPRERL